MDSKSYNMFKKTFGVRFGFVLQIYLIAPVPCASFVVLAADDSVLCYPCGTATAGFVVYRPYSVERIDVF